MTSRLPEWQEEALARAAECWQNNQATPIELARARRTYNRRALGGRRKALSGVLTSGVFGLLVGTAAIALFAWRTSSLSGERSAQAPGAASSTLTSGVAPATRQGTTEDALAMLRQRDPSAAQQRRTDAAERAAQSGSPVVEELAPKDSALIAKAPAVVETGNGATVLRQDGFVALAAGQHVTVKVAGEAREFQGPGLVELRVDPDQACGWHLDFVPQSSSGAASAAGARAQRLAPRHARIESNIALRYARSGKQSVGSEKAELGAWSRTAEALRSGDYAIANRELASLEKSPNLAVRDAARLSRIQLLLSQGQEQGAAASLRNLTKSPSPLVRRRAAEMLETLETP